MLADENFRQFDEEGSVWVAETLSVLHEAFQLALDLRRDRWDFAVEIQSMQAKGANVSRLRWLICKGYVKHSLEVGKAGTNKRLFETDHGLRFTESSCFVISDVGLNRISAKTISTDTNSSHLSLAFDALDAAEGSDAVIPCWDADRHELFLEGQLVKRFRHRSPNQERVLNVFEEDGWPPVVRDPLIPNGESCPKRRLNDTIKGLNHCHENRLIRFRGDGTGEGVLWELCRPRG